MPIADIAVLISLAGATVVLGLLIWRWGGRGRRFAVAFVTGFAGLFLTISMVAHCLDVLSRLIVGTSYRGEPFIYDFRAYSLFLLGAVLIVPGVRLAGLARRLARSDAGARRDGARSLLVVLAIIVPLLPVHALFATIVTTLAVLGLLALAAAREARAPVRPGVSSVLEEASWVEPVG